MKSANRTNLQALRPDGAHIKSDLIAGLTFAVVNVPQAMAHALLATVNPVLGIYTLMVAVPVGAIFTSSVFMNVSSTSVLSVATGAGLVDPRLPNAWKRWRCWRLPFPSPSLV